MGARFPRTGPGRFAKAVAIVALLLAVAFGSIFATFALWPWGAIGAGLLFVAIGWFTGRWWTVLVIPVTVAIWAGATYLSDPSGFDEGYDLTPAAWFAIFGIGAAVAAGAVFVGVLLRRTREHVRDEPAQHDHARAA